MTEPRSASRDFPPNGWYPEEQRIPKPVQDAGTLLRVDGGLTLLLGFILLVAGSQSLTAWVVILAMVAVAVVQIRAGFFVRRLVPWGRRAGIGSAVLAVLLQLVSPLG